MTNITTNGGETTVAFGYDDANRKIWEDQTVAGAPTRRVETWPDADGNRTGLYVYGYYLIRFDHTQRNQLAHIYDGNWQPWFTYHYGAAGNVIKRQNVYGGVNDSQNSPDQWYDALNRPVGWENTWVGDGPFNRSWYQYDRVGREVATWRDEDNGLGSGRGERYEYEATNQLKNVAYNAQNVWTTAQNATKTQGYAYTPDRLNRATVTENGAVTSYALSGMNQYIGVNGAQYDYDANFNLSAAPNWGGVYDAQNRLTYGAHGGHGVFFTYDGLGRCVRRVVCPPGGGSSTMVYVYDGWKPIIEFDGAGNYMAWTIYGTGADETLGRWRWGVGNMSYHSDVHGNVIAVLDGNGNVAEKYTYDAFGKPKIMDRDGNERPQSWIGNRFMFQGREWIAELGIYDYRHRMYHPDLGRFLQTDPMGLQAEGEKLSAGQKALFSPGGSAPEAFSSSEMNLFRYCGDDPVDGSDPLGLYGRGDDFKDDRAWRKFDEAQKVEANHVENRLTHMDKQGFENEFGKGSATGENMARIRDILKGVLTALRDDGSQGYVAHIAQRDLGSGVLAKGVPNGKDIYVHVENPFYNVPSRLEHAIGHEGVHNFGVTGHGILDGVTAYKYGEEPQKAAFRNLPSAERLRNPDHIIDYAQ